MSANKAKVHWEGPYFFNHSLSLVNREVCKRLITENKYNVGIISCEENPNFQSDDSIDLLRAVCTSRDNKAHITVRHQWPPNFNKPNSDTWVLFQPWEFGAIPRSWYIPMKYWIDEIWVYSTYNKESYIQSGIPEEKIKVIPLGIDETIFNPDTKPFKLPTSKSFRFLFVGGTIFRKGIDILLQAYVEQFSAKDDVCLIIKDFGTDSFYKGLTMGEYVKELQQNPSNPEILYIDNELSISDVAGLYKACNCLVHPYRGEGFGLPIIEAMACGTPAIVPSLGPITDFCTEETTFFVQAQEEPLAVQQIGNMTTVDTPRLLKIDQQHLQQRMRYVYENSEIVKQKGEIASKAILSQFTWNKTASTVSKRLNALMEHVPSPKNHETIIELEIQEAVQLSSVSREKYWKHLYNLLELYPDAIPLRWKIAISYLEEDKSSEALEHLLYITMNMSEHPETFKSRVWIHLGGCYFNLKNFTKAIEFLRKGISPHSQHIELLFDFYKHFIHLANKDKTLSIPLADVYRDLGDIYVSIHNDLLSKEMYEKALEFNHNRPDIQRKLALVQERIEHVKHSYIIQRPNVTKQNLEDLYLDLSHQFDYKKDIKYELYKRWLPYFLPGEKVLDIGCGEGIFMEMLEQVGVETEGIDLDTEKVKQGKEKGLRIHQKRAEDFLLDKEAAYDGIILGYIIEHMQPQDVLQLLSRCKKVLNNTGKLLLLTPNISHPSGAENFWLDITHVRPYPKALIEMALKKLDFSIKEAGYWNEERDIFVMAQKQVYEMLWESVVFNSTGYAEEQKAFLDLLRPFPIAVQLNAIDTSQKEEVNNPYLKHYLTTLENIERKQPLIHYQASPAYLFHVPRAPISIGRTMFETDRLPSDWLKKLNMLTEIWVPTQFNKETFVQSGVEEERIFIMPPSLDTNIYNPKTIQPFDFFKKHSFHFLSIFDWNERKGWDILLKAFMQEFKAHENVCLTLKITKNLEPKANPKEEILKQALALGLTELPRIQILSSHLAESEMLRLYTSVDAFVLPSRGEGYGRPYMEAMAMALPTIGTRWGGQTDFMNDENGYLIEINGVFPIRKEVHYFGTLDGHKWAEPNLEHLRLLMRTVYENREEAKKKGLQARQDITKLFSKERIAHLMFTRIDQLVKRHYGK